MSYKFYISEASNLLLFATVRISVELDGGIGIGTGFFFSYGAPKDATKTTLLVTNKHVVEDARGAAIRFHRARHNSDAEGRFIEQIDTPVDITIPDLPTFFVGHPDPSVDLCAVSWPRLEEFMSGYSIFYECVQSRCCLQND